MTTTGPRRSFGPGLGKAAIAAGVLAAVLLAAAVPSLAQQEMRRLLEELWIDIPARSLIAPPFSLVDFSGAPVRLADHQGRLVMLYFWTTW